MKTNKVSIATLVLILFTSFAIPGMANDPTPPNDYIRVKVTKSDEAKKINLRLYNLMHLNTTIRINGVNGVNWFTKSVKNDVGYAAKFNLANLPNGDYFLFVEQEGVKIIQFFSLGDEEAELWAMQQFPAREKEPEPVIAWKSSQ